MRKEFSKEVERIMRADEKSVFITADLGYNALENIRDAAQERFINAGVAEQNMVGVAAGLASKDYQVFVYNIAPFAVFRCFEQIKIDVCLHKLPVCIVGNGGGYGYGIMGATHHAIEDLGCLGTLAEMTCWIPAFTEDVVYCLDQITKRKQPAYLRLGSGNSYPSERKIGSVNTILKAQKAKVTVIALGPVAGNVLQTAGELNTIDLFTILEFPVRNLSDELAESILATRKILVIEEHVQRGGLSENLLSLLARENISYSKFVSLHAKGYPDGTYGDQQFHQQQSGLDPESIKQQLTHLSEL